MRRAIAVALVLFAFHATAGTISSISPSSVINRGEHFVTVNGSGFTVGDQLVFTNSAGGQYIVDVNAFDSMTGAVTGWVPTGVVLVAGTYTLQVRTNGVDSNGVSFVVTKQGRLPLKLHLPDVLLAISKGRLGAGIKYDVTTTGGDPASTVISCEPESGSTFPLGLSTVKCSARDGLGGSDGDSIPVNVYDGTAPVVTVPKSWEQAADDERGATLKYEASASDDVDGALQVSCSHASGSLIPNGRTNVLCEAIDASLNGNAGTFSVLVWPRDIGVLQIKTPEEVGATQQFKTGAYVEYEAYAYGSADPDPVLQCTPASGEFFRLGPTKVYCTAVDDFDQRAEASFVVYVREGEFMMADVNAEATDPEGAEVLYELKAENWTEEIKCSPEPGSRFALGATTVNCESRSANGLKVTGKFEVTVADTIAPHIGRAEANVATAAGANGVPVSVIVEAIDAVDVMPRCAVSDLTAEAPVGFDWRVTSDLDLEIRSEGRGAFRIQVTCSDAAGNRSSTTVPVAIESNLPRRTGKVQ